MSRQEYSAALTGEQFLFHEIRQVARLKLTGYTDKQIYDAVANDNLFQYETEKSLYKRTRACLVRVNAVDETILRFLVEMPAETSRIVNLYVIAKINKLLMDFIIEVIGEKFEDGSLHLEKKDMVEFFIAKSEQHPQISTWTDNTIKRLRLVLPKMITEAGILGKDDRLYHQNIDPEVVAYFTKNGELGLLKAMGINV